MAEPGRVAASAVLAEDVVLHDDAAVEDGVSLGRAAVVGKPPRLAARSSAPRDLPPGAVLEAGARVADGAIVLAGARLGPGAVVGEGAYVRERAVVGAGSVIGTGAAIDNDVVVGERVSVGAHAYLTAGTVVEDEVVVEDGVMTSNDNAMGRHAPGAPLLGATLRRGCRIGARSVLVPGVEVGAGARVQPDSVVARDVAPGAVVGGVPARSEGT